MLGSMKELGDFAPAMHAALAEPLAEAEIDHAILVGPHERLVREGDERELSMREQPPARLDRHRA